MACWTNINSRGAAESAPAQVLAAEKGLHAAVVEASGIQLSLSLLAAAQLCDGLSGRVLRKLPFLAQTTLGVGTSSHLFLESLKMVAAKEVQERQDLLH
jgi:hypothetical protein